MTTPAPEDHQRQAARVLLDAMAGHGFALAGSGAIREHGLTQRPTADVDLFTADVHPQAFTEAVDAGTRALDEHGYRVTVARRADQFARLAVTTADGYSFDVDMGVDWRAHTPVMLSVGPVLDLEDAVANKIGALYSRGEPRDFLDVDAIRRSGRFTGQRLIEVATSHDPGFDTAVFVHQLALVDRLRPEDIAEYGNTAEDLAGVKRRLRAWIDDLRGEQGSGGATLGARGTRPRGRRLRASQAYLERSAPGRESRLER